METNERRTWAVIWLCGALFGSIALVADGLHMSTHAGAVLIAAFAHTYPRRHAADLRFVLGTGKLGDLAGGTSAIVLARIALLIGHFGSMQEIPEPYEFSAEITLRLGAQAQRFPIVFEEHGPGREHGHGAAPHDNNMRAAFVHVMADAAVSTLVIAGLLMTRAFGWLWMDPLAGIVGAIVVAKWSHGLVRDTGAILLDMMPDRRLTDRVDRQRRQPRSGVLSRAPDGYAGIVTP